MAHGTSCKRDGFEFRYLACRLARLANRDQGALVEQAGTDTLLEWFERILTAETIDYVRHRAKPVVGL